MKTGDKQPVRENNTEIKPSESLGLRQGGLVLLYFGDKCIGLLNPCHWSCDSHGTHTHTNQSFLGVASYSKVISRLVDSVAVQVKNYIIIQIILLNK